MAKKGVVYLKAKLIRKAMAAKGLSPAEIKKKTNISKRTTERMVKGLPVRLSSAMPLLGVLGLDYDEVIQGEADDDEKATKELPDKGVNEWEPVETLSDWRTTPNGLQYKTWRMAHRHLDDRFARGKQYDLTIPSTKEQDRLRTVLRRHPDVCGRFRGHPQIAINLTATPSEHDNQWWVIDEWIAGQTLAEVLEGDTIDPSRLAQLMLDIALGLEALHGAGIIRRELSPQHILLRDTDGSAVLTDFELAKLLDGSPTVAGKKWPKNRYRAPEVGGVGIDETVDLYSWGRILVHAQCGEEALEGNDREALRKSRLPKPVRDIAMACVNKVYSDRPSSIAEVIKDLGKWR